MACPVADVLDHDNFRKMTAKLSVGRPCLIIQYARRVFPSFFLFHLRRTKPSDAKNGCTCPLFAYCSQGSCTHPSRMYYKCDIYPRLKIALKGDLLEASILLEI